MLVLLDRDGVINKDLPQSVTSTDNFFVLPHVGKAIKRLNDADHRVAIITNQACVGRGDLSPQGLEDIHQKMIKELSADGAHIDKIYVCTDTTVEPNNRRKPAPGMILEALSDFKEEAHTSVMVGDAMRDLQAAHNAGCPAILVLTGKGEATLETIKSQDNPLQNPVPVVENLAKAVDMILDQGVSSLSSINISRQA